MSDSRLDVLLVERHLASTRTQAQKMIVAGQVKLFEAGVWRVVTKPSLKVHWDVKLDAVLGEEQRYVSRAGLKLEGVLKQTGFSVKELVALDIGQSTGGFTDCLLQHGCKHIVGVDVGHSQLHESLKNHSQVSYLEGINARSLVREDFTAEMPNVFDIIVMDVSFISQTLILPQLPELLKSGGYLLSLIKPQFEVGKKHIGKGGIVKDVNLFANVRERICGTIEHMGFHIKSYSESSITGGDGNTEFIVIAQKT